MQLPAVTAKPCRLTSQMKTECDAAKERRAKENRRDTAFPTPSDIGGGVASYTFRFGGPGWILGHRGDAPKYSSHWAVV